MKNSVLDRKPSSAMFIIFIGTILMVAAFIVEVWIFYDLLRFDDPIARSRVLLNLLIIAASYALLILVTFKLFKSKLHPTYKALFIPALLITNTELMIDVTLATNLLITNFYLDVFFLLSLTGFIIIKKLPWQYLVGVLCNLFWFVLFFMMMAG